MSLATNVMNLATRVATEFKAVYAKVGNLSSLTTTEKTNLVGALNEIKAALGGQIDDATASSTTVYSSSKTMAAINAAISALTDSAPGLLDTLNELAAALGDDPNFAATMSTALGNRVRVDAEQVLTAPQQAQARANIGAAAASDLGDPATDFVATFVAGLA